MIERVAKAIHDAWGREATNLWPGQWIKHEHWEDVRDKRMYLIQARAAIEAMREPTDAMRKACHGESVSQHWALMIDAALK